MSLDGKMTRLARADVTEDLLAAVGRDEAALRRETAAAGLTLVAKAVTHNGRQNTWHWMFNDDAGRRVLDYWPTNGKWRCPRLGTAGVCNGYDRVLELAASLLALESP